LTRDCEQVAIDLDLHVLTLEAWKIRANDEPVATTERLDLRCPTLRDAPRVKPRIARAGRVGDRRYRIRETHILKETSHVFRHSTHQRERIRAEVGGVLIDGGNAFAAIDVRKPSCLAPRLDGALAIAGRGVAAPGVVRRSSHVGRTPRGVR